MSVSLIDGHIDDDATRMTDNEIIKAFRCCYLNEDECEDCPCFKDGHCTDVGDVFNIVKQILDLINHQKAEIDKLKYRVNRLKKYDEERDIALHSRLIATSRAEAVKEFFEKLKEIAHYDEIWTGEEEYVYKTIDFDEVEDLVEEMVGDAE